MREVKKMWLETKTAEFLKGGKAAKAQEVPERWVGASSRAGRCPARARPMAALEKPSPSEWAVRCRAGCSVPSASRGQLCPPASRPPHPAGGGHGGGSRTPPRRGTRGCRGHPGFRRRVPSAPGFSAPCWGQARPWAPAGFRGSASPGILPPGGLPPRSPREGCRERAVASSPCRMAGHAVLECAAKPAWVMLAMAEPGETWVPPQPSPDASDGRYVGCAAAMGRGVWLPQHRLSGRAGAAPARPGLKGEHGRAAVAVAGEESEATQPELI